MCVPGKRVRHLSRGQQLENKRNRGSRDTQRYRRLRIGMKWVSGTHYQDAHQVFPFFHTNKENESNGRSCQSRNCVRDFTQYVLTVDIFRV